jgi:hypothetical protein
MLHGFGVNYWGATVMTSTRTMGRDGATLRALGWDGSSLGAATLGGADPLGFAAGDANLYRYVGNDPTDFTDPDGLQKQGGNTPLPPNGDFNRPFPLPIPDKTGKRPVPVFAPTNSDPKDPGHKVSVPTLPPGGIIAVTGADPCVGLIFVPPKGSKKPYDAYHCSPSNFDLNKIIRDHKGYTLYITGDVTQVDDGALKNRQAALDAAAYQDIRHILLPYSSAGVDANGKCYGSNLPRSK